MKTIPLLTTEPKPATSWLLPGTLCAGLILLLGWWTIRNVGSANSSLRVSPDATASAGALVVWQATADDLPQVIVGRRNESPSDQTGGVRPGESPGSPRETPTEQLSATPSNVSATIANPFLARSEGGRPELLDRSQTNFTFGPVPRFLPDLSRATESLPGSSMSAAANTAPPTERVARPSPNNGVPFGDWTRNVQGSGRVISNPMMTTRSSTPSDRSVTGGIDATGSTVTPELFSVQPATAEELPGLPALEGPISRNAGLPTAAQPTVPRLAIPQPSIRPMTGPAAPVASTVQPAPVPAGPTTLKPQDDQPGELAGTLGSTKYLLAEQPKAEDHYQSRSPLMSSGVYEVPYSQFDFAADPVPEFAYDPEAQQQVYAGKTLNANQRPLIELGKPWYQMGQIAPGKLWFGKHNPVNLQFLVYGDLRSAFASNVAGGNQQAVSAMRWNLDFDLRLTSTERFHWFMGPLDRGGQFTRVVHDAGETHFISEFDPDIDFGFFEGDAGAIWGGLADKTLPFDAPFAVGVMPLLFQNGVWLEDAFMGWAVTIPARNSPTLDISNMDITFFGAYDKVTSAAFAGDDHAAKLYGMASFIEALGGYFELDYAFLEDRTGLDRSYHNSSIAYTRRYGRLLSNSLRVINNAGQSPNGIDQTADGTLLLFENSLISGSPLSFVPYMNGFVGFDRPQSAARAAASGGVLRNTGILFETDGLTGSPTLDATANNTFGGAVGLNMIAKDFSQQLIVEAAMVQAMDGVASQLNGEQYGVGVRYQLPLSNSVILRMDGMYGWASSAPDLQGYRIELRKKW